MNEKLALYCLDIAKRHIETAMGALNCGIPLTKSETMEMSAIALRKQLEGNLSADETTELEQLIDGLVEGFEPTKQDN